MGRQLNAAFEKRQIGEYEYTCVISNEDAEELLEQGREFAEQIAKWLESAA